MRTEIIMPRLGTNDEYVTLGQWLVKKNEYVKKGQAIAVLETTKETSDLLSESEGYIQYDLVAGQDYKVGTVLGYTCENASERKNSAVQHCVIEKSKYTKMAIDLINQYDIDTALLPTNRIIKEKDVLALIKKPYKIAEYKSNKVVILGGGGFCRVIIDILKQRGEFEISGILEKRYPEITSVMGVDVIGKSNNATLADLYKKGYRKIINAVGFVGKKHGRKQPYDLIKKNGFECVNVIHKSAIIEPSVSIGEGNLIVAGAIIGSEARIGNNCIINAAAVISHNCIISDSCHIASGAILGGSVIVGENTLIGQGCTVFKNVKIGSNCVIANGVHIFRDIPDNSFIEE